MVPPHGPAAAPVQGFGVRPNWRPQAIAEREIVKDRAVRAIVAMARGDEVAQRLRHSLHFGDARLKVADMRLGDAFDFAARAAAVAP